MPSGRAPASHLDRKAPRAASFFTRAESKTGMEPGFNLATRYFSNAFHDNRALRTTHSVRSIISKPFWQTTINLFRRKCTWKASEGTKKSCNNRIISFCSSLGVFHRTSLTLYTRNQSFLALRKCVNALRFLLSSISRPVIGSRHRNTLLSWNRRCIDFQRCA